MRSWVVGDEPGLYERYPSSGSVRREPLEPGGRMDEGWWEHLLGTGVVGSEDPLLLSEFLLFASQG